MGDSSGQLLDPSAKSGTNLTGPLGPAACRLDQVLKVRTPSSGFERSHVSLDAAVGRRRWQRKIAHKAMVQLTPARASDAAIRAVARRVEGATRVRWAEGCTVRIEGGGTSKKVVERLKVNCL